MKSRIITDPNELYRFLTKPGIGITNLLFASDDVAWASWQFIQEENIHSLCDTNEVIGAYVTAGVRLKVHSYLERLGIKGNSL
jgi:hypothetical protein